jgi:hypothetical protein
MGKRERVSLCVCASVCACVCVCVFEIEVEKEREGFALHREAQSSLGSVVMLDQSFERDPSKIFLKLAALVVPF